MAGLRDESKIVQKGVQRGRTVREGSPNLTHGTGSAVGQQAPHPIASKCASLEVAALFVERGGVYWDLPGVDPWDEERDARLYAGPWPVVAHPPCNKWSPLAYINQRRLPGYVVGDDGGCFEAALHAVRTWGGVLEHPANSMAWRRFDLPRPTRDGWSTGFWDGGWVCEVDQGRYGHRARKSTWLYAVDVEPPALDWGVAHSDVIVSGFLHRKGTDESRRVRPAEASRTPIAFRDVLLAMARSVYALREVAA